MKRTGRKSFDVDKWTYSERNWTESEKSIGYVKVWHKIHSNAAGCYGDTAEIKRAEIGYYFVKITKKGIDFFQKPY